jgi:hypothetical protein
MSLVYPTSDQLYVGYAHSIADMNDDFISDLIVTTKTSSGSIRYQILTMDLTANQYKIIDQYSPPSDNFIYGQSLFADFGQTIAKVSTP